MNKIKIYIKNLFHKVENRDQSFIFYYTNLSLTDASAATTREIGYSDFLGAEILQICLVVCIWGDKGKDFKSIPSCDELYIYIPTHLIVSFTVCRM